ncbi:hypothetical protein [Corynebacterium propinquum]|uniref:hypothetical protein n=1 Tax=Corynebacterium propinquum TaxID=43769 RepID=UPI0020C10B4B|nr:hypothetical protein [Corynebacterium propinquum]MDK4303716.1 hypothetical protein [Corynebacterium propinquum]UQV59689.1 hypothetical protein L9H28_07755 [Corynebacterium propinquum]
MVQSNFDYDFELFNLHSFCRLAQNQRKPMAFSLRKTSYVVSACVVGIQFISPLFPDGSVSALGWTLGLAIIPLILGIAARSPRAVVVAIVAGFSPVLLLWAAFMVSFLLYIVSFGNIVWV